jgi:hypothetical protein
MIKWEYKTLYVGQRNDGQTHSGEKFEEVLNNLGDKGWELVGKGMTDNFVTIGKDQHYSPIVNEYSYLVFKRQK